MESENPFPNIEEDLIIGSATTIQQIIDVLAKRGCSNLTLSINLKAFGDTPCAGGGYCDIYRGALHDGTIVAVKSLRFYNRSEAQADSDMQKMLKRAARELYHWSKLRHHNVLPLMGLAIFRGKMSMVSKWMEHGDLRVYLRSKPDANRKGLCMDICEGLCYIHANEMVHGDLKAANVMVSSQGVAMIADFGNTQLKDLTLKFSATTRSGFSVRWTAPELLHEECGPQLTKEADVYAYGMTMLEVLTGEVPYEGTSDQRVLVLVLQNKLPTRPNIDLGDGLWELLNSCWDLEPFKRPKITMVKNRLLILFWPPTNTWSIGSTGDRFGERPPSDPYRGSQQPQAPLRQQDPFHWHQSTPQPPEQPSPGNGLYPQQAPQLPSQAQPYPPQQQAYSQHQPYPQRPYPQQQQPYHAGSGRTILPPRGAMPPRGQGSESIAQAAQQWSYGQEAHRVSTGDTIGPMSGVGTAQQQQLPQIGDAEWSIGNLRDIYTQSAPPLPPPPVQWVSGQGPSPGTPQQTVGPPGQQVLSPSGYNMVHLHGRYSQLLYDLHRQLTPPLQKTGGEVAGYARYERDRMEAQAKESEKYEAQTGEAREREVRERDAREKERGESEMQRPDPVPIQQPAPSRQTTGTSPSHTSAMPWNPTQPPPSANTISRAGTSLRPANPLSYWGTQSMGTLDQTGAYYNGLNGNAKPASFAQRPFSGDAIQTQQQQQPQFSYEPTQSTLSGSLRTGRPGMQRPMNEYDRPALSNLYQPPPLPQTPQYSTSPPDEDTLKAEDYRAHMAAITRMLDGDGPLSLAESSISTPPALAPVPRVASQPVIQAPPAQPYVPPATKVISRDFALQEEEDYDGSGEDDEMMWQVPKQNSTPASSNPSASSGGTPLVRRTATRPKGLRLRIDGSRASETDSSWDISPQAEVYEKLEQFFPNHDLDQPVIDAPSGGTSPITTEPPSVAGSTPAMGLGVRRHKKSIRVVPAERKKMLERINAAKIQQPTIEESTYMSDSTVNAGTAVPAASILRKRSTKMWGGRVEEVVPGTMLGTGLSPNLPATIPEERHERQRPTFKWVKGQLIGRGRVGRVYHAMNLTTGEMIAVKQVELPKTDNDRADSRLLALVDALKSENDILRDLDHPHIVQHLGFEETTDTFSVFLEYVPGGSVGSVLRKFGKFEDGVVRSFSHQIIDGLAYLHKSGILHRDLKGDSILVDPSGICKISDFAISERSEHVYNNHEGTTMQGSVFWMAPEMLHNNEQRYNAKIDIWSVGCVVLEMQAGRRPWAEEDMSAVLFKVGGLRQAPPVPDYVHLTPLADDFRRKCFAVDPAERPTAAELLNHPWLQVPPGWVFKGFN